MTPKDQTAEFKDWLEQRYPGGKHQVMAGASNGAFPVGEGFRIGIFNLEGSNVGALKAAGASLVLGGRLQLPGDALLHVALAFSGAALDAVGLRLTAFGRANNVRVYLHRTGVYFRDKGDLEVIDTADATLGAAIPASEGVFADVERTGRLEAVEVAYVNHLSGLLAPAPLVRLGASTTTGGAALDPASMDVATLVARIRSLGGVFDDTLVQRFHVALNHLRRKHFVLLAGISGTGKTLLAKAYAYAVLGESDMGVATDDFHLLAVRPDWTEPAHLTGFLDAITGKYSRTRFLDAVLRASRNPHRPVFVCLDEMNLAQPEHYFAEIMSAMETGEALVLHDADPERASVPARVPWPENLYITGTVNVDETTRPFSPKLLDRAQVIDMSRVDLPTFAAVLAGREPALAAILTPTFVGRLDRLRVILEPHALHFGNRVVEEIARYLAFAGTTGVLGTEALDLQIEQKILTKVRGGREQASMIDALLAEVKDLPTTRRTVERMRRDLESYDSFQYWS